MSEQSGKMKVGLRTRKTLFNEIIFVLIGSIAIATLYIKISAPLTSIDFWSEYQLAKAGSTFKMHYSTVPDYFNRSKLEWTSSDNKIAYVSEKGEINAVSVGIVTITVKGKNGISDSVTIEVCNYNC